MSLILLRTSGSRPRGDLPGHGGRGRAGHRQAPATGRPCGERLPLRAPPAQRRARSYAGAT